MEPPVGIEPTTYRFLARDTRRSLYQLSHGGPVKLNLKHQKLFRFKTQMLNIVAEELEMVEL